MKALFLARGIVATACLLLLIQGRPALSLPIFEQTSAFTSGRVSDVARPFETADDFTLAKSAVVSQIRWRGGYAFGATGPLLTDDFTIRFYTQTDHGVPAQMAFATRHLGHVQRVDTGFDYGPGPMFEYTATIRNTLLLPDQTTLYMSIVNDSTGSLGHWFWDRSVDVVEPIDWYRNAVGGPGPWLTTPPSLPRFRQSHTFTLIPEPAIAALLGVAMIGFSSVGRRGLPGRKPDTAERKGRPAG